MRPFHGDGATGRLPPLLRVDGLCVGFPAPGGHALAADRVEFSVRSGETLGIVGESGSGKSVSMRALLGVVPIPGRVLGGSALWRGDVDLLSIRGKARRAVRGREIAMIFQDPQESLNPVFSIGDQLGEVLTKRAGKSRRDARRLAVGLLDTVGIPGASRRLRDYPHHLSGGMRQRVMIAIAIACEPALLLADEPTTALDVTIQDQILTLLADLQMQSGMAMILVSHDLSVVAQSCDRVSVMYAGRVVEAGETDDVLLRPRHPYTSALLAAVPSAPGELRQAHLEPIEGSPPAIEDLPPGCSFAPRCRFARAKCETVEMVLDKAPGAHRSACPWQ